MRPALLLSYVPSSLCFAQWMQCWHNPKKLSFVVILRLSSENMTTTSENTGTMSVETHPARCRYCRMFDVGVTVRPWYYNINSRLDSTMIILLTNSISSTCFGRSFRPSSGALDCVYSLWYNAPKKLPAGSIVGALYHKLQTQSSAPENVRNYRPKHVELIEFVNKIIIVASRRLFILLYCRVYLLYFLAQS